MFPRQGPVLVGVLFFAALALPRPRLDAQPVSLSLAASRTSVVVETTTPVEVLARFSATVSGVRLVAGTLENPLAATQPLTLNESATQLAAEFSYLPSQSQPQPSAALDTAWPPGAYGFHLDWKLLNGNATHGDFSLTATGGWPAMPVVQAPQPLLPFPGSTVDFTWLPWNDAPASGGSVGFTLYEGLLTVELIEQIAAGDYSGLATFSVVDTAPSLAAATTTRTSSGIDPELDHILMLEFNARTVGGSVPTPSEARSSRMLTFFYRDEQTTYAEWRATQFSEADRADDAISGPAADPDQDGVPNLLEYASAMQPLTTDNGGLPKPLLVNGAFAFDYWRASAAIDLTWSYEALAGDNTWQTLSPGSYTETTVATGLGRRTVRVTPAANDPRKLIRVRVTLAPTG